MSKTALISILLAITLAGCYSKTTVLRREAISEYQIGHNARAMELFQQVIVDEPADSESLYYLGRIMHAEGYDERAIYYFQAALDADSDNAEAAEWLDKLSAGRPATQPAG